MRATVPRSLSLLGACAALAVVAAPPSSMGIIAILIG